ncbi:MAG: fused MFS/spermidine synthase [bacterium]
MRRVPWWLLAAFLVSGAAGLVYEVVWSKVLSHSLGNSLYAISTVVAAYLGGLAFGAEFIGTRLARRCRLLRSYALIEWAIALFGIASVPALRATDPLFAALHREIGASEPLLAVARWAILSLMLIIPTALMGATLPLLVAHAERRGGRGVLARLYATNTLGAMLGTLGAALVLIPALGLTRAAIAAAGANVIAGIIAWRRRGDDAEVDDNAQGARTSSDTVGVHAGSAARSRVAIALLIAGAGFIALSLEVCWTRILILLIGSSVHSFAFVLAAFLFGIALGSALFASRVERAARPLWLFAALLIALAFLVLAGLFAVPRLPGLFFALILDTRITLPFYLGAQALLVALLVVPPCIVFGALFPLSARLLDARDAAEATGRTYLFNTTGTILGSLATGFFLIPMLGSRTTLVCGALVPLAIGVLVLAASRGVPARARAGALACGAAALALLAAAPAWDLRLLTSGVFRPAAAGMIAAATDARLSASERIDQASRADSILFLREGVNATVSLQKTPATGNLYLKIGGKTDASLLDRETQLLLGHLPMFFADDGPRALVIGHGSGMTLAAVLAQGAASAHVVEMEEAVLTASRAFHAPGEDPLDDPRTRVVVEDGRTFLAATRERFDVIVSEPSNPWLAGTNNLFTRDFYEIVRARLAPDGVFAQWIQLYELTPRTLSSLVASFRAVFPDAHVFLTTKSDLILVAAGRARRFHAERFAGARVAADLARFGATPPERVLAHYACELAEMPADLRDGPLNTDDNVLVEYRAPLDLLAVGRRALFQESGAPLAARIPRAFPIPFETGLDSMTATRRQGEGLAIQGNFAGATRAVAWLAGAGARAAADSLSEFIAESEMESRSASLAAELSGIASAEDAARLEARLRAYLAAQPDETVARFYLGVLVLQSGRGEEADALFEEVARRAHGAPAARANNNRGLIAMSRGDAEAGIAFFRASRALRPDLPESYLFEARALAERGDAGAALALIDAGLAAAPGDARLREFAATLGASR